MTIRNGRILRTAAVVWAAAVCVGVAFRVLADCSSFGLPFTDLDSESTFCAAIAEAYYTGITNGSSATTFSPNDPLTRAAGAAFATRALDGALTRGSRRAALGQWWTTTPAWGAGLGLTVCVPSALASDGTDRLGL